MTSMKINKTEAINELLGSINLDIKTFWTHNELLGQLAMASITGDFEWVTPDVKCMYHFGNSRKEQRIIFDDTIIVVDYQSHVVDMIVNARPTLGYCKPSSDEIVVTMWPIIDGTTFRYTNYDDIWRMSTQNCLDITNNALFDKTFGTLLAELIVSSGITFDTTKRYTVNMSTKNNCPYKDTVNSLTVIETIESIDDELIVTVTDDINAVSISDNKFGEIYRTLDGIYINRSKIFDTIAKTIYNVDNKRIRYISTEMNVPQGQARKTYIIARAILTANDTNFVNDYSGFKNEYLALKTFIESLCRSIYSQCSSRVKSPKYSGSFVGITADRIGPLKTASGKAIVRDTIYTLGNVQIICMEYIKFIGTEI